jgi:hypothetical protein
MSSCSEAVIGVTKEELISSLTCSDAHCGRYGRFVAAVGHYGDPADGRRVKADPNVVLAGSQIRATYMKDASGSYATLLSLRPCPSAEVVDNSHLIGLCDDAKC